MDEFTNETMSDGEAPQAVLDRLVDGELTDRELREVLLSFDGEVEAWRRCALAFIERQTWERDLGGILDRPVPTGSPKNKPTEPVSPKVTPRWHLPLAMAASMLLAFLAMRAFEGWSSADPVRGKRAASNDPQSPIKSGNVGSQPAANIREVSDTPAGRLTLTVDEGNAGEQNVEIPFYDEQKLDDKTLAEIKADAIPRHVETQLREQGHRLVRERQVLQVELDNGRHILIPVEQIEIVPAKVPVQ